MVQVSYPGVYIEEVPSGVHTVTSVSTSIAAFIDFFKEGPMDEAVQIFGMADFGRIFGGLDDRSEASYAISQFFLNGGSQAYVVRVAAKSSSPVKASVTMSDSASGGADLLKITAANEGVWGNNLRIDIDLDTEGATKYFNMYVTRYNSAAAKMGKDGWILSRYLMKGPAARSRLIWAEKELSKLHKLEGDKKSLEQERRQLKADNKKLQKDLDHIRKTAANAVAVADENAALKLKAERAEQAFEALRQETSDIRSGAQQRWFMLGGGAILLGLILPRLKFRRKDRWGRY